MLWGLVYILGPGLFQPLEQELARATAARAGRGEGSAPVLRQAARIGLVELAVVWLGVLVAWPLGLDGLLDDRVDLLASLLLALSAFMVAECVRGILSGRHEFSRYSAYFATEGLGRLGVAVVLAIVGIEVVGAFGVTVAVGFAMATAAGIGTLRPFVKPGPPAPLGELTPALGWLLAASLGEAILLNVGPVALDVVGDDLGDEAPGIFLNGLIISRIPLFFFQAVKAALLPNLAHRAVHDDLTGFRTVQLRLVAAVSVVAAGAIATMAVVGPTLVEVLFGDEIRSIDMALLAAGAGGLMVMLSLSLGLVALDHTRLAVAGYLAAIVTFPVAVQFADDPFIRVESGLVAAVTVGALTTAVLLRYEYGVHSRAGRLPAGRRVGRPD